MAKMQGLVKAYGGLGCPKKEHMDCAIWSQLGGDTCHKVIGWREGQDEYSTKEAQEIRGSLMTCKSIKCLCKSHKCL